MHDSTHAVQAAQTLLKLYELRTEPALRKARAWFALPDPEKRIEIFERYMARQRALAEAGKQHPVYGTASSAHQAS